ELLKALNDSTLENVQKSRDWPKTPKVLADILRRIQGDLRAAGVEVSFKDHRELGNRRRQILIHPVQVGADLRSVRPFVPPGSRFHAGNADGEVGNAVGTHWPRAQSPKEEAGNARNAGNADASLSGREEGKAGNAGNAEPARGNAEPTLKDEWEEGRL